MKKGYIGLAMLLLAGCTAMPPEARWEDYAAANRCEATDHPPIDVWVSRAAPPTLERFAVLKCKDRHVWVMQRNAGSSAHGSLIE
jgi:hypothetical protein